MTTPLRILLIEDSCDDAELLMLALLGEGLACDIQRVETRPELDDALVGAPKDVVICDGHLPGFDGGEALAWVRAAWPSVPFVFCLGSVKDTRIDPDALASADGCVGKNRLHELPPLLRSVTGHE